MFAAGINVNTHPPASFAPAPFAPVPNNFNINISPPSPPRVPRRNAGGTSPRQVMKTQARIAKLTRDLEREREILREKEEEKMEVEGENEGNAGRSFN